MAAEECWPWWHGEVIGVPSTTISSGCSVQSNGAIPCDPEDMRADAEAKLAALGFPRSISLDAYALARTMQSEVGSGTPEERVALGELTRNQAAKRGISAADLLLTSNIGRFFGPIHGIGTGVSTAPYGRWASTSQDPTASTLILADLVDRGDTNNFIEGGLDQDGPEAWISQGQGALNNYVQSLASRGLYWIGPKPGIDHWRTFIQYKPGPFEDKAELIRRALDALSLPAQRPQWGDLPICAKPLISARGLVWLAGIFGAIGGAVLFERRALKRFGL